MTTTLRLAAVAALALATTATNAFADDCRDNRAAGTVLGAIAGGVIGGAVSHGNGGAVVGGVILGGIAGHAIASDVDCDDRPYAYRTYREALDGPIGERYEWDHKVASGISSKTQVGASRRLRRGAPEPSSYLPFHCGARFSAKAFGPSRRSSLRNIAATAG